MKFLSDILAKAGLTVDGVVTLNNTATGQTPNANDNSTKLATTAWVRTFVQPYSLPIASASILGGVKVGSGLSINSSTGVLSVVGASAASIKSTQTFVVTEGQTVFTVTGGYTPGLIDIFLNGVYLSPNQTVATNGTTFTINDPAATGDVVDVIVASAIFEGSASTTDQLPEGVVNLYYTNARARAAITLTTTGVSGAATYNSSTGVFNIPNYQGLVPAGGVAGDILAKVSGTNYDVTWIPNFTSTVQHTVKAAVAVTKGQAVYVSSADGTNMIVSKASNATEGTSSKTLGLVAQDLAINGQGFVVTEGLLAGLNTSTANAGDPVWLGTNGNLIFGLLNKPTAPAHLVFIGIVTRVQSNNGEIFVKVQNGFELDELHDLSVKNPTDGDMIKYVASTGLWTKIAATTTNITEGTNLYYTQARFDTAFAAKSTTNLAEGTNLYYTNARARAAISVTGSGSYDSATGVITVTGGVTSVNTLTGAVTLTTTNIGEGTNLYYTTARVNSDFDTRLATKSTTNLAEGTNLYYTTARVNSDFDTRLATKSTTNLAEGTNLYYTDARVGTYLTNNSYATQSYVSTQINNLVSGAPGLLDTLDELAAALGDDPNFATTVSTALSNRLRIDINNQGLTSTQQGNGRTNLGLGSLAVLSSVANAQITDLAYSKLTGVPSTFAPSAHTHPISDITGLQTALDGKQASLSGTGFVKINGSTISYDNSTYYLASNPSSYITQTNALQPIYGDSGAHNLNVSGQQSNIRYSTGLWLNGPISGNYSHVLSFNLASDNRTVQMYLGDVPGYLWWRPNQAGTWHPWERIWTSNNLTNLNQLTNGPGYITGYTETDTLASVTARGATTSTATVFNGGLFARRSQTAGNYTTAALWTESYDNTTTGIAFHISGNQGKFLEMRTNGILYWHGDTVWHSGNLTNLNQLSNGPGYITSYTETDTLATVTARGASTASQIISTSSAGDGSIISRNDGSGTSWRGRIGHWNATADKSVWLATYNGFAVVGAHNNALNAWADLLVNCVNNNGDGGTTRLSTSSFVGSNAILHAGNFNSYALPLSGGSLSGNLTMSGAGNSTSIIFGDTSKRINVEGYWMMFKGHENEGFRWQTAGQDGVTYTTRMQLTSSALTVNGNIVLHAGNYNSYAPTLTGGGASGTWGINITGESHGIANNGNAISGMGPISNWDSRPGVGQAAFGINWHTGVTISGYGGYGGVRLYASGYPTHAGSVLRLEASDSVKTFGGLFSDGNAVIHAGNIGSQSVNYANYSGYSNLVAIPDWRDTSYSPNTYTGNRVGWHFNNVSQNGGPAGDFWGAMQTVAPWSEFNISHRQMQLWWGGSAGLSYRYAVGSGYTPTGWSGWERILTSSNFSSWALSLSGGGSVNGSVKITSGTNDASGFTNSDLGNAFYTDRGGRLLTSNGANWASDGRDPALVISGSYSDTNRGRIGLAFHNETTANNAFAPMIAFSTRSQSGGYNTVYASIMGRYTGYNTGVDTNWASGELHFYAHGSAYVDDTPTMRLTGSGFLQVASGGGSSTATLSLLQTGYSNAYVNYTGGKMTIGGDSGLNDGIYFNMYNGSSYGDRFIIKPSGRVNIISGGRTLSLGDGNYSNHILVDSNVDFAFNYNNGSTGGFGFFGGTGSAKFMCSYTGTLTVSGDVVAYGSPSDARLKDIKEKVPNALDSILKLNGYRFNWKEKDLDIYGDDKKILHIKEDIGVIAQEVADVLPELAKTNEDGFMSVRYQGLTAVLIEAVKEQQVQIESQKSEIEELKDLVKQLINR